jgi:hypothetical protein|tara:strand:+ start:1103 stop:1345 length:243 start_codon:yes stop_codon:yes gene_type:complete
VNHGDNNMTLIKEQLQYDQVKKMLQNEVDRTIDIINKEQQKENSEEVVKNLANYFIILSNINQAITLVSNIKPTQKKESD